MWRLAFRRVCSLYWLLEVSVPKLSVDNGYPDYFGCLLPEIECQSGSIPSSLSYSPIREMSIRAPDHYSSPLLEQIPSHNSTFALALHLLQTPDTYSP